MGIYYNPRPVNSGLIFAYDMGNTKRSFVGRPTTNFFTNGHFSEGNGIPQESGSNPTNEVVQLNNPGNSPYVLRQSMGSQYTEYQINLTTELVASTTYVMSGWYGESTNYVCAEGSRMFHSRAFSTSGAHNALGIGIGTVITSTQIDGILWRYCYATITTPSDYSNLFNWYVGYGNNTYTGYRYYTNLQMELGNYPSTFVDGTRSSTQSILDFTNNRVITASDLTFNNDNTFSFDGVNDVITTDFPAQTLQTSTLEAVVYDTKNNGAYRSILQINTNTDDALYINPSNNLQFWPATASTLQVPANQWNYVCASYNGSSIVYCVNGEFQEFAGASLDFTNYQFLRVGGHGTGDGERFKGNIPIARVYNRALSRSEMLQNYSAFRGRFGI